MVFIEQPCGVGFSYSDQEDPYANNGDYVTDDAHAAKDNYALIQAFFDIFPQYRTNDVSVIVMLCSCNCMTNIFHSSISHPNHTVVITCHNFLKRLSIEILLVKILT
jgi:hypothetical protein